MRHLAFVHSPPLALRVHPRRLAQRSAPRACLRSVTRHLDAVYGDEADELGRWRAAHEHAAAVESKGVFELTYGELNVAIVARALRAAKIRDGERLVDVGSGFGRAAMAAALLHPRLTAVTGIEVVPRLHEGAVAYHHELLQLDVSHAPLRWLCGDYRAHRDALAKADVALCFATTWGTDALQLRELSAVAAGSMRPGSRVALVDKTLCAEDGWSLVARFDAPNEATGTSTTSVYEL